MAIFWRKPWVSPFGKISIFWSPKVGRFLTGLTQDFELFNFFLFWKRVLKMSFDDLLHTKQAFLDVKNLHFLKYQNFTFF